MIKEQFISVHRCLHDRNNNYSNRPGQSIIDWAKWILSYACIIYLQRKFGSNSLFRKCLVYYTLSRNIIRYCERKNVSVKCVDNRPKNHFILKPTIIHWCISILFAYKTQCGSLNNIRCPTVTNHAKNLLILNDIFYTGQVDKVFLNCSNKQSNSCKLLPLSSFN